MKNKIALILILVFAVMQLFTIEKVEFKEPDTNDLFAIENVEEGIEVLIRKNCYDCHSNQVKYPWYSNLAPVSWWIQDHIEHGREHLNFSEWGTYSAKKKAHKAEEAYEEVEEGEMPLPSYAFIHRHANLNDDEKHELEEWFKGLEAKYK